MMQSKDSPLIYRLLDHGIGDRAAREVVRIGEVLRIRTQEHGTEFAAMVDVESGAQIGDILGGVTQSVDTGPHLNAMRAGRQYVHLHTHPSSSAFSRQDAAILISNNSIQTMGVIGSDGTWYLLSRATQTIVSIRSTFIAYNQAIQSLETHYEALVQRREVTQEAAWREHSHEAWQRIATQVHLRYDRIEP